MALAQRFSVNKQSINGSASGVNLSMNDIIPIQPVSKGSGVDDEKLTLQQIQAIPYGAASLSGTTYNVTFSNYPTDFNPVIGQTIIIKFNNAKAGTDALNLSINGQLIPMLMQGEAITEIAANQIIEFTMIGNIVNNSQTITHANASAGVTAAKVNNQINGALANKAEYQDQNSNAEYVNSNDNKYLVIQRQTISKIYYFNAEAYFLIDDAGNKLYILSFIRNDNGVNASLTSLTGNLLLSVYKVSEEYCVLQTSANWPKKYTVYSLNGYKPRVYATSVSPL